ncbi:hypothetical protein AGMMS49574_26890 [Bacteroidia bacterium]|nr:hypothetical protein AGMMS49574_26890 [Bacteroidia bacterium]
MSPDEETAFQEHLEVCGTCCSYLNEIRSLSSVLIKEEEVVPTRRIKLSPWMSIAAGILLIVGFSLFWGNYDASTEPEGELHDVFINYQERAILDSVQSEEPSAIDSLLIQTK